MKKFNFSIGYFQHIEIYVGKLRKNKVEKQTFEALLKMFDLHSTNFNGKGQAKDEFLNHNLVIGKDRNDCYLWVESIETREELKYLIEKIIKAFTIMHCTNPTLRNQKAEIEEDGVRYYEPSLIESLTEEVIKHITAAFYFESTYVWCVKPKIFSIYSVDHR
jgi:hypothetical protein